MVLTLKRSTGHLMMHYFETRDSRLGASILLSTRLKNARNGVNILPRGKLPWDLPLDGASSGCVQASRLICR